MSAQRRKFTAEFKREPVALVRRSGRSANQVALELAAKERWSCIDFGTEYTCWTFSALALAVLRSSCAGQRRVLQRWGPQTGSRLPINATIPPCLALRFTRSPPTIRHAARLSCPSRFVSSAAAFLVGGLT